MRQQKVFELLREASEPTCGMGRRSEIINQLCPAFNKSGGTGPSKEQIQLLTGTILLDTLCHSTSTNKPCSSREIMGLFPLVVAGICDKSDTSWLATVDWETHKGLNKKR
jgi:hypothetical protein